jgi:RimJ/RimL family protein N-acetyltransferase
MRDVIEIETKRLRLRPVRMSDAPAVACFMADTDVTRMLAAAPQPYLPIAAEGWIMTLAARAPLGRDFVFAVERAGEGLIGVIGAHDRGGDGFEIGYWLGRPYWGQGFATEALCAFVSEARGLGELGAGHFVDNPASGRVLEKGGFTYTGETENLFSFGRGVHVPSRRMRYDARVEVSARAGEAVAC